MCSKCTELRYRVSNSKNCIMCPIYDINFNVAILLCRKIEKTQFFHIFFLTSISQDLLHSILNIRMEGKVSQHFDILVGPTYCCMKCRKLIFYYKTKNMHYSEILRQRSIHMVIVAYVVTEISILKKYALRNTVSTLRTEYPQEVCPK